MRFANLKLKKQIKAGLLDGTLNIKSPLVRKPNQINNNNGQSTIIKSSTITHGIAAVSQKTINSNQRKTSLISTSRSSTPSKVAAASNQMHSNGNGSVNK